MLTPKTDSTQNNTSLRSHPNAQAFLYHQPIDMRKSINGLSILVEQTQIDILMNGTIFVFYNRTRDKIKLLYWECNGCNGLIILLRFYILFFEGYYRL